MNEVRSQRAPPSRLYKRLETTRRGLIAAAALVGAALLLPAAAHGQERFPARTVRVIVPFPAGATTDMLARLFAGEPHMTSRLSRRPVTEPGEKLDKLGPGNIPG